MAKNIKLKDLITENGDKAHDDCSPTCPECGNSGYPDGCDCDKPKLEENKSQRLISASDMMALIQNNPKGVVIVDGQGNPLTIWEMVEADGVVKISVS